MKRFLPLLILLLGVALVGWSLRPPGNPGAFDVTGFGRLPILANGRIKPLDTVARSSLLQLQNRQRVSSPTLDDPFVDSPTEWLLDVFFRPEKADTYPTFAIDNPELLTLLGKNDDNLRINYTDTARKILGVVGFLPSRYRRFTFEEIAPHVEALQQQAKLAEPIESAVRSPFQRAVLQLYGNLVLYQQLRHALVMPGQEDFLGELLRFQDDLVAGVAAVTAKQAGQPHDEAAVNAMVVMGDQFDTMARTATLLAIPPDETVADPTAWKTTGDALLESFSRGGVNSSALAYAGLAHAWRKNQPEQFNKLVGLYRAGLARRFAPQLVKTDAEARFNAAEPFYLSMILYACAFFLAVFSWLAWPDTLGKSAFYLVAVAWLLATVGIATRMWLEGRPPVTNLYSSALFIGWGSVALCLVLEAIYKNAIGSVAAGITGFATLLIAHHLSLSGDTLEMMRAVLDSNFWLATHVVVVTTGYAATFLAGFLALIYVVMGVFTPWLSRKPTAEGARAVTAIALSPELTAKATSIANKSDTNGQMLARMVYGIVCFATLFSFVGTVLGGIWADQSWGRFWGWDPKENGAVLIVIWNALILHARWGGMIKARGLMSLAIFGNIVTSWSWFGTNMLGVGLHSYGFTDAAFWALSAFVVSQLLFVGLANLPLDMWRSFRRDPAEAPTGALPAK